ncbi:hypothetical protein BDBG_17383 [Blastomyces gilchristii SLH14081]|uniref:Uncharacterized protein n=1 Tax=Blastomyces gilchristii (strain SLH14081) TaxID=559298 RepID=A0A179URX2_BLAGS|nr:uncharacterized protein BDBG_17383 [Blastomyces gilchristii SLH14081]OAT10600.1 hypothetical protein BDBG_17383 [Blastomyces gilchristii SLH14081]
MIPPELGRILELEENYGAYRNHLRMLREKGQPVLPFIFPIFKEYQMSVRILQQFEPSSPPYETYLRRATSNADDLLSFRSYTAKTGVVERVGSMFKFCICF